jgi:hypothetical protein
VTWNDVGGSSTPIAVSLRQRSPPTTWRASTTAGLSELSITLSNDSCQGSLPPGSNFGTTSLNARSTFCARHHERVGKVHLHETATFPPQRYGLRSLSHKSWVCCVASSLVTTTEKDFPSLIRAPTAFMSCVAVGLFLTCTITRISSPGLAIAVFKQCDGSRRSRVRVGDSSSGMGMGSSSRLLDGEYGCQKRRQSRGHGSDHNIRVIRTMPIARANAKMTRGYHWTFATYPDIRRFKVLIKAPILLRQNCRS